MKQLSLLLLFFPFMAFAQNAGCDGSRYLNDVFTSVKKTTVQYATAASPAGAIQTLSMDVYEPENDTLAARPVVVLAHGGSFIFGDKNDMAAYCTLLAKKGYVAATINYRLWPVFVLGYPDSFAIMDVAVKAVGDMKAAVRYFREDAATTNQFHADAGNIFIGGYSAGAVTALHTAYLDADDVIPPFVQNFLDSNGGLEGQSGSASNHNYSSSSKAVLSMSGGIYRSYWVDAPGQPIVSIHGTADETVNYVSGLAANIAYLEGSSLIHAQALSAGISSELITVPGAGHTNLYSSPQYAADVNTFWQSGTSLMESLVCASSGLASPEALETNWSLYPNPGTDNAFTLILPEAVSSVSIRVMDLQGRVLLQRDRMEAGVAIQLPANAPVGMYVVEIADQEGRNFPARRWVKQ